MLNTPITLSSHSPAQTFFAPEEFHYFPCFFSPKKEGNIAKLLTQQNPYILELGEYVQLSVVIQTIREQGPCHALSLTTKTAFSQPIAEYMSHYFHKRFHFSDDTLINIQTCLQEALSNAIIHGNLQMEHTQADKNDFMAYYEEINQRLNKQEYCDQRVNVYVWEQPDYFVVCIEDQGKGFSITQREEDNSHLKHGRGLNLIHTMADNVWQGENKSSLFMSFKK